MPEAGFKIAEAYVEVKLDDSTGPGKKRLLAEMAKLQPVKVRTVLDDDGVVRVIRDHRRRYSRDAAHAGTFIGEVMGRTWQKSLTTALAHPYLKGPAFSGIVAGAQVAGASAGLALTGALGVQLQASNGPVAEALAQLQKTVTRGLQTDSGPFADKMVQGAERIGYAYDAVRREIQGMFRETAPHLDNLTDGVIRLGKNALPGLVTSMQRSRDVSSAMADAMGDAGTGASRFFLAVTEDSTAAATSIRAFGEIVSDAGELVGSLVGGIGSVFAGVSDEFVGSFDSLTRIIVEFSGSALPPLTAGLEVATTMFGAVLNVIEPFAGVLGGVFGTMLAGAVVVRALSGTIGILHAGFTLLSGAAVKASLNKFALQAGAAAGSAGVLTTRLTGSASAGDKVAGSGGKMVAALGKVGGALPMVAIAVGLLSVGYETLKSTADDAAREIVEGSVSMEQAIATEAEQLKNRNYALLDVLPGVAEYARAQDYTADATANVTEAFRAQYNALTPLQQKTADVAMAEREWADAVKKHGPDSRAAAVAARDLAAARRAEEEAAHAAKLATRDHTQALIDDMNQMLAMANADLAHRQALYDREKAQRALTDAIRKQGAGSDEAKEAAFRLEGADLRVADAAGRLASETGGLLSEQQKAARAAEAQRATILDLGTAVDGRGSPAMKKLAASMSSADLAAHNAAVETSGFAFQVRTLPDGRRVLIAVDANKQPIYDVKGALASLRDKDVRINIYRTTIEQTKHIGQGGKGLARGGLVKPMAAGGILGFASGGLGHDGVQLTPMSGSLATVVPPNTWRVIGDNLRVPELFAPLDGSRRSLDLISMGARSYGLGLAPLSAPAGSAPGPSTATTGRAERSTAAPTVHVHVTQTSGSPAETGRFVALALRSVG